MHDRILERNIERLEAFVEHWSQLSQFLDRAFQGATFTPDDEAAFLQLKSHIAQEHEVLLVTVAGPTERDERTLRLLNQMPSLQALKEFPEGLPKKLVTDWHTCYMSFQAWLGRLKGRQAQLAGINSISVAARNVLTSPVLVVFVVAAAAYGVYKFADEWIPKLRHAVEQTENK